MAQLVIPLRWYLGAAPVGDERFAWRMFSRDHYTRCAGSFYADGQPVDLREHIAPGWTDHLTLGNSLVVEPIAHHLCQSASRVTLTLACTDVRGTTDVRFDGHDDLCAP